MFQFILLLSMFLATALAFAPAGGRFIARQQTLVMGSLLETFKFKKIMNRFTFKTLAEAIEAAGLVDAVNKDKLTIFAPTDNAFVEYILYSFCPNFSSSSWIVGKPQLC